MVTRAWIVYGRDGHRQRVSFRASFTWNFTKENDVRIITCYNSDILRTNDYSVLIITRNTAEECEKELNGQLTDGIFEDSNVGKVEEI